MRTYLLISLLFFIALAFVNASESDVKVLTEKTFDEEIATGEWLLEFYAPWCGHCKSLAPKYEELATKVKGKFNIAKIDCTVEKSLQTRFGIRGFPTIKFLKDGELYDYQGQRTVEAFVSFLEGGYSSATHNPLPKAVPVQEAPASEKKPSKTGSSDVVTLTFENFEQKTSKGEWFLEFYAPWCGHCKKLAPIYEEVATQLKGKVHVGKVNCEEEKVICSQYGIRGYPTVYYKRGNELREYNAARTADAFKSYAEGGWESVKAEPVPEPVSAWKLQAYSFLGALENGIGSNIWVVVGICVVVGVILGVVVVTCTSSGPSPKTIHYTAPASEGNDNADEEPVVEEVSKDD